MFCNAIVLLALSLAIRIGAQIPILCADKASLTEHKCCPAPSVSSRTDLGECGVNDGRGSCKEIMGNSQATQVTNDVRQHWPLGYFSKVCKCSGNFGGFDCGECSFGYKGERCSEKAPVRTRKSINDLTQEEWEEYRKVLQKAKSDKSRYKVVTTPHTNDLQKLMKSMKSTTVYELFVWMHHFVAKDSELEGACMISDT